MSSFPVNPEVPIPTFDPEVLDDEVADDEPTVDEDGERLPDATPDAVDKARADRLAAGIPDDETAG